MDHEIRQKIILKLIHTPRATYNQLWDKKMESGNFAYHLKKLEEEGFITKFGDEYGLTAEGRKFSAFIEGDTGGKAELPTPIVIILVRDGDKWLYQERRKEPFYGYWGPISGKVNFGWNPCDCAVRDLKEEAGLDAQEMIPRSIQSIKTYENGKVLHHHLLHVFEAKKWSGELITQTHKAVNKFLTVTELQVLKRFPSDFIFAEQPETEEFFMIESERYMENGTFVGSKILNLQKFKPLQ
jgi:ADP-ribose pyrophosphatase YjhB (NUDIX family)